MQLYSNYTWILKNIVWSKKIMPVGKGSYRYRTFADGTKVRLHFTPSGRVNEAKNMKTGKVHTAAEFKADRAKAAAKRTKKK